jgi:hypothetical protein
LEPPSSKHALFSSCHVLFAGGVKAGIHLLLMS